ncbi:MAG: DNA mismatch repair endonuclease MutL [bacterium]|nr:MAG: DNA mismatch repair endonuclease MutL [bacterium]
MSQIKVLPPQIANKIAAGEVVDRPAAVVKELIENAIDAEATHISVVLEQAGKNLIQVIDNGSGIPEDQVSLAFQRHATSKIDSVNDLDRIITLGFRGEALPSIASVSRLEMRTCTRDNKVGTAIILEGGVMSRQEAAAMKPGTIIAVKNLFYNTPARRNFLRADVTEFNHINRVLKRFFLSYPEISFQVIHNEKEIYNFLSTTLDERISQVLGTELYEGMVYLEEDLGEIRLEGFLCRPDLARNSSENQFLFLNKRPIISRRLSHAILQGFGNLIERSQYPQFVFFLQIAPQYIDINVHPTKMEVRFANERTIYQLFLSSVRKAIQSDKIIPQFSMTDQDQNRNEIERQLKFNRGFSSPGRAASFPSGQFSDFLPENQLAMGFTSASSTEGEKKDEGEQKNEFSPEIVEQPTLWQVHNRYICSQIKSGLVIIDQHVAHERILYEKFIDYLSQQKNIPSQKLLFPQTLELALEDFLIFDGIKDWLRKIGFHITILSGRTILIEAIPADVKVGYEGKILLEIIDYYRENEAGEYQPHERIAAAFACKNAIKSGEKLSQLEMNALIDQLFATREPYFCPHGRPVIVTLSLEEIDRKFKRI